ncbi:MAG: N-acetylneuraminate synthase family protein [Candidatus Magasanikbacteria bacterium]
MAYIISEIGGQFGGSIEVAEQMMLQSKIGGANAVKFQLYSPDFDKSSLNHDGPGDYLSITFEDFKKLKEYADKINIEFFAAVFDSERLRWCLELDLPKIKVSRAMVEEPGLFEKVIKTGKEAILSLNAEQVKQGKPYDAPNVKYLYTVPSYPTMLEQVEMPDFGSSWIDGYSDHTAGLAACVYALSRGAKIIEKHFTVCHSWQKTKEKAHLCSMDMGELQELQGYARSIDILRHKKLYQFDSLT